VGKELDSQLSTLQTRYLRGDSTARADLARLRRALGKPAGSVPEVWHLTILSPSVHSADETEGPTVAEQAAHAALTLFALHQQSSSTPIHQRDMPFGAAAGRLRDLGGPSTAAVSRRFLATATAQSIDEVLTHVRGLVTQFKSHSIGMDYAAFADDLVQLLTPGRQDQVRLSWGRDFHRNAVAAHLKKPNRETPSVSSDTEEKIR
jgi:CRISPR system Cascade subunit CasB